MNQKNQHIRFLKTAVSDFRVGAISRSSKYVVRAVTKKLPGDLQIVMEYGAGDGVVTREILNHIPADARLIAIESNEHFARTLATIDDPRLIVIHGTVQEVTSRPGEYGIPTVDAVISSIPFSFIPPKDRRDIVSGTHRLLNPGGTFIVFHQYSPFMALMLKRFFSAVDISFEPRNILPCFLMRARKKGHSL